MITIEKAYHLLLVFDTPEEALTYSKNKQEETNLSYWSVVSKSIERKINNPSIFMEFSEEEIKFYKDLPVEYTGIVDINHEEI